jgi:glycosyltransferase involved in cell wall biosynthesis
MNLFIDAHVFDEGPQGTTTYLKGLYKELIKSNKNIIFYFGANNIVNLKEVFGESANIKYIKYWTRNKYLRLAINIPYIIIRNKIDISHYQYILPLFRLSREILTLHDILFMDYPLLFPVSYKIRNEILFKTSAKRAEIILTVSTYSKERITKHFKIESKKIHVIPNGVDEYYFETTRSLPDIKQKYNLNKYILYVSRFEPRKNHILLLRAFIELELWKDGYKLVLVGSRTLETPLFDAYLESLTGNARNSILIINRAIGDELNSLYRNCKLFIYPSLAEGFGIPPLEAAASGVPVLCSGLTAMSDFGFFAGQLFDASSLITIKEKITQSLEFYSLDKYCIKDYIMEHYNWIKSAESFKTVIFNDINSK